MKHTDFSLIPTFLAIMEESSYTGAAKKLGVSQSAVSQNVVRLRDLFQDPLFVRERRGIKPTPVAFEIYPELSQAANAIRLTTASNRKFDPKTCSNSFSISSLNIFGLNILPKLVALIAEQAPDVKVKTEPLVNENFAGSLRDQNYDLVLDIEHNQYPYLESKTIIKDTLCIVCREDHPRLVGNKITLGEYLSERHVAHSILNTPAPFLLEKGYSAKNVLTSRNISCFASGLMEMLAVVESTDCIGVFPKNLMNRYFACHKVKVLENDIFHEPLIACMYWHPSRNEDPKHRWFRQQVLASVE